MSKLQYKINLTKKQKERMNNNKTKNPRAWQSLFLLSALSVLLFGSCSNDTDAVTAEIALTTPVVELGGVSASASRAAGAWDEMVSFADLYLYMQDAQGAQVGDAAYYEYYSSNSSAWSVFDGYAPATVKGGPGSYRAGIIADIHLNAVNENGVEVMPAISGAMYGYRGTIEVQADGSFAPMSELTPQSSAVQWKLNDANGDLISIPNDCYLVRPVGLAYMFDFASGDDDYCFPNGTAAPVPYAGNNSASLYTGYVRGDYCPGTYPATWPENQLVTSAEPTQPWPLAEVVYCAQGFEYNTELFDFVPTEGSESTTWTVSYPAQQLTLEAGKLYTFTITLGKDAHITLDAENAVSIAKWNGGSTINVGR